MSENDYSSHTEVILAPFTLLIFDDLSTENWISIMENPSSGMGYGSI
jgi:hypothetical protein